MVKCVNTVHLQSWSFCESCAFIARSLISCFSKCADFRYTTIPRGKRSRVQNYKSNSLVFEKIGHSGQKWSFFGQDSANFGQNSESAVGILGHFASGWDFHRVRGDILFFEVYMQVADQHQSSMNIIAPITPLKPIRKRLKYASECLHSSNNASSVLFLSL